MRRKRQISVSYTSQLQRRFALLALLVLGAVHVTLAAHQFQHVDPTALGEPCSVCLQMERFDEAAPDPLAASVLHIEVPTAFEPPTLWRGSPPVPHYSSRAPPTA